MIVRKLASILALLILTGCSTMSQPDNTVTVLPTYGDLVAVPKAQPTNLKNMNWMVMNQSTIVQYTKDHSKEPFVLYSLDEANMKTLIGNMDDMARYIQEQNAVITYLNGLIDLRRESATKEDE